MCVVDEMFCWDVYIYACGENEMRRETKYVYSCVYTHREEERRQKNRWNHRKITNECFTKVGVTHNTFFIVVGA